MIILSRKILTLSALALCLTSSAFAETYLACGNPQPQNSFDKNAPVYFQYVWQGNGSKARLKIDGKTVKIQEFRSEDFGYSLESNGSSYTFDETACIKEGADTAKLTITDSEGSKSLDCACTDD